MDPSLGLHLPWQQVISAWCSTTFEICVCTYCCIFSDCLPTKNKIWDLYHLIGIGSFLLIILQGLFTNKWHCKHRLQRSTHSLPIPFHFMWTLQTWSISNPYSYLDSNSNLSKYYSKYSSNPYPKLYQIWVLRKFRLKPLLKNFKANSTSLNLRLCH